MAQLVRKVAPLALVVSATVWTTHCAGHPVAPAVGDNSPSNKEPAPILEIWNEEIPVMCSLAVAMDGTVLLFKEQRDEKRVIVKRSSDGGETWSAPIEVGKRVKIDSDMSDDGRYRGKHVGWSELGSVIVDENTVSFGRPPLHR